MNNSDRKPLVSVIIPVYNGARFVSEAVDSALRQDYENLEVIVIDDGSIDDTLSILSEYVQLITVLQHPGGVNLGVSLTRKLGVDHARGKYVAFLDADDSFESGKISAQIEALEQSRDVVLCHTAATIINEDDIDNNFENIFNYSQRIEVYDLKKSITYVKSNRICNSSVVINIDILKDIPFYGKQMFQYEDWLMWILAAEHGKFIYLPVKHTRYRLHGKSSTSKVLNSKIIRYYSRIELFTSILSRSVSKTTNKECSYQLLKAIDFLRDEYGLDDKNNFSKNTSNRIPFFSACLKYYLYKSTVINKIYCYVSDFSNRNKSNKI